MLPGSSAKATSKCSTATKSSFERLGLILGGEQDAIEAGTGMRIAATAANLGQTLHLATGAVEQGGDASAGFFSDGASNAAFLFQEGQQEVFGLNLLLATTSGEVASGDEGFLGLLGETVHVHRLVIPR